MVARSADQVSLADAKSRLSEVIDGVQAEHRRVVITRHGKPAAVLLAPEDLEALEETLDLLADPEARDSLHRAVEQIQHADVTYLSHDEALSRWTGA